MPSAELPNSTLPSTETPNPAAQPPEALAEPRRLHPLPRGLVELYGLLAVLFVLVPEWMAGGALAGLREGRVGSELPVASGAWRRVPELRLASMTLAELRQLAGQWQLRGYGRLDRDQLTARLLRRIQASGRKPL